MDQYSGKINDLDIAVRQQLSSWFPVEFADDILKTWELKGVYDIKSAQPSQFGGSSPANVNGGKDCSFFRDEELPSGIFVCGDHMATATLNGVLESEINTGKAGSSLMNK